MELLLIRHGQADVVGSPGVETDEQRDLTATGVERTTRAAVALNRLDIRINAILASPCPRAMHTARILCDGLQHTPQLRASEHLRPGVDVPAMLNELKTHAELGALAVCGHEPNLSALADRLLGSRTRPSLIFHTGSIAFLQVDLDGKTPAATLHWFVDSRQLDLIAHAT